MKKENFEKLFEVYDALMTMDGEDLIQVGLDDEIKAIRSVLTEAAQEGVSDGPRKFGSSKEIEEYFKVMSRLSIRHDEPEPAQHSALIAWSQRNHEIVDCLTMEHWPTWEDGELVRIGEKAVSTRGPMEIIGIEVDGSGYTLWGLADFGDIDEVTGNHLKRRYIIDQGHTNHSHPVREGEYCDFWPESEEDALEYYGKDVLYKNTGRAHLLEEEDGQEG